MKEPEKKIRNPGSSFMFKIGTDSETGEMIFCNQDNEKLDKSDVLEIFRKSIEKKRKNWEKRERALKKIRPSLRKKRRF